MMIPVIVVILAGSITMPQFRLSIFIHRRHGFYHDLSGDPGCLYLGRKKLNRYEIRENKVVKVFLGVVVVLGQYICLEHCFSSPVVNAKKYRNYDGQRGGIYKM